MEPKMVEIPIAILVQIHVQSRGQSPLLDIHSSIGTSMVFQKSRVDQSLIVWAHAHEVPTVPRNCKVVQCFQSARQNIPDQVKGIGVVYLQMVFGPKKGN